MLKQCVVNINELIKLSRRQKINMTFLMMFNPIIFCEKQKKTAECALKLRERPQPLSSANIKAYNCSK